MRATRFALALALAWVTAGCQHGERRKGGPWSDTELLAEGSRYLDDPSYRRAALVSSLSNPNNTYSRQRLADYALVTRGWDRLPEWNPRSVTVTAEMAHDARSGRMPALPSDTRPLWDGVRPSTVAGWVALGRETFARYPLRAEPIVEWALAHPDVAEAAGVRAAADGSYPGLVVFADTDGRTRVGITCALCHADVRAGSVVAGRARRSFDYGKLRIAHDEDTGAPLDSGMSRRLHSWGPGRADVTEDDDEDPVSIPDLWGLRYEAFLTRAGTIQHTSPAALAIRQETQLLTNQRRVRPPREIAFGLALALYALAPPPKDPTADDERVRLGKALFERTCRRCHANPAGGGDLVAADLVDTDGALAYGGARGTGFYRTAPLIRVAAGAPYFHDGSVATLEDVLAPERLEPSFRGGFLGPGAVRGHDYGTTLPARERAALVAYLRTL